MLRTTARGVRSSCGASAVKRRMLLERRLEAGQGVIDHRREPADFVGGMPGGQTLVQSCRRDPLSPPTR